MAVLAEREATVGDLHVADTEVDEVQDEQKVEEKEAQIEVETVVEDEVEDEENNSFHNQNDDECDFPQDAALGDDEPPPDSDSTNPTPDMIIDLLNAQYAAHVQSGNGSATLTAELKSQIELLAMLKAARAPYSLFWKWAQSSTRTSVIKELCRRYNLARMNPSTFKVKLPACGEVVELTTHDFLAQLLSLLTDPVLMRDENLLFYGDNPFVGIPPQHAGHEMRDINDGSVFRLAHTVHVTAANRDLLVPIILFIDKTFVNQKGRLTLEPVSFTLGIFKKEVRNHPFAWRPLGYIVNQDRTYSAIYFPLITNSGFTRLGCLQPGDRLPSNTDTISVRLRRSICV